MATGRRPETIAKREKEQARREKRERKQAKKDARAASGAQDPTAETDTDTLGETEPGDETDLVETPAAETG